MNDGKYQELKSDYLKHVGADQNPAVERPPIEIGGKKFQWFTNFGVDIPSTFPLDQYATKIGEAVRTRSENLRDVYFVLARHGVGVIPEVPSHDSQGRPINDLLAFYRDERVPESQLYGLLKALEDNHAQFFGGLTEEPGVSRATLGEIDILVDDALHETGITDMLA